MSWKCTIEFDGELLKEAEKEFDTLDDCLREIELAPGRELIKRITIERIEE